MQLYINNFDGSKKKLKYKFTICSKSFSNRLLYATILTQATALNFC